ncbi:TPA: hypothetical protein ACWV6C_005669, partial [Salmonella enterica subsp. enterica serovar Muenchen]
CLIFSRLYISFPAVSVHDITLKLSSVTELTPLYSGSGIPVIFLHIVNSSARIWCPPGSLLSLKRLPAPGADNDVRLMKTGLREFMQRGFGQTRSVPGMYVFPGCGMRKITMSTE